MPVITDVQLPLTVEEITASWGPRRARLTSTRMMTMVSELLARAEANRWIQPKVSFDVWPIVSSGLGWIELSGGSRIFSRALGHHIPRATQIAAGVCTIGPALEEQVSQWFAASDRLRAVMLDEIGTVVLFGLGEQLEGMIRAAAARLSLEASGALCPGEDGIEISQQATVLKLVRGETIGILQATSAMLAPRKSLSMLFGLGSQMRYWSRGERCVVCSARDRCPHRRVQTVEVAT